jgi:hypothetical protein
MSESREEFPCARGCAWEAIGEEPPRPKPADRGTLCASDYYRLKSALAMIPDLMANMRAQMWGIAGPSYEARVSGGGGNGAPIPMRVGPVDAADSLYAKLASWATALNEEMHARDDGAQVPVLVIPAWFNAKEVQGSLPVTVETTMRLATQLVKWFTDRLDDIAASQSAAAFHDDICYGWEDAKGVFSLSGTYGIEARPVRAADKRECPICGAMEVFVKWPNSFDGDLAVMCSRCAWVADPEKTAKHLKAVANG